MGFVCAAKWLARVRRGARRGRVSPVFSSTFPIDAYGVLGILASVSQGVAVIAPTVLVLAVTAGSPSSRLPFTDLAGSVVVDARIDGQGPFHFVLDTGAGTTVITPRLASVLRIGGSKADEAHGTGPQVVQVQTTTLDTVEVGDRAITGVAAAIIPLPPDITYQGRFGTIDGLIGYSFLKHFVTTIDYATHTVILADLSQSDLPVNVTRLPLEVSRQGIPLVPASVDGHGGRFEIDTGNNGDSFLSAAFVLKNALDTQYPSGIESEASGVGGHASSRTVRLATIELGSVALHALPFRLLLTTPEVRAGEEPSGNLGYELLKRFRITLDYRDGIAYFEPNPDAGKREPIVVVGLMLERNADGDLTVRAVTPGTPAATAGLHAGDVIVAVNGVPAPQISDADYAAAIGESAGRRVAFTIRSSGLLREVTVTTQLAL